MGTIIADLNCYPFAPPERMQGVWVVLLEGSTFYPNVPAVPQQADARSDIWLEASPVPQAVTAAGQGGAPRAYAVEFIGRRSICPAGFGHMGVWPNEVVVSRFLRMTPLPLPGD